MAEPESGTQAWRAAYTQSRLATAYTQGWDSGNDFVRKQVADLLERSVRERAELEERVKQLEKERNDFFYWAENLASHGFNCTERDDFIPLASEYWSEMAGPRNALALSELKKEEQGDG